MDRQIAQLAGLLLMLGGVAGLVLALTGGVMALAGFSPGTMSAIGLVSIEGYPLVGTGAFLLFVAAMFVLGIGSRLRR